jgi:hypothetical protein
MIQPALLVFAFYFLTSPPLRGGFAALGALVKFSPLVLLPLWSGYPDARDNRSRLRFAIGAVVASLAAFSVLLFDGRPWHDAVVFFHHTFGYQFGRSSPFSLWDWRQYRAKGLPDLHLVQQLLEVALVVGAAALYRWPRHRGAARRVRDDPHPLVVALPPVVLPVRGVRGDRPAPRRGAGRRERTGSRA